MNIIAPVAASAAHRQRYRIGDRTIVAGEAVEPLVSAVEAEVGLAIVVELPDQPVVGVVTHRAIEAELLFVDIVLRMAVHAFARRIAERRIRMTAFTRDRCMESEQRELRDVMIETNRFGPALLAVAVLARRPERTLMHIARPMTAIAVRIRARGLHGSPVTGRAYERCMSAVEREARIDRMIEGHLWPRSRRMAGRAIRAVIAGVNIIGSVTGKTFRIRRIVEGRILMAGRARKPAVTVDESEACFLEVIEARVRPTRRRMTILTDLSVPPRVHVVHTMTGDAPGRRLDVDLVAMTAAAGCADVVTGQ